MLGCMLVQLGARTVHEDVVDLLVECHGRIRTFLAIAGRLADADAGERGEAASQVIRYFTQAFPLHLADEDELVSQSLAGHSAALDGALAKMRADHTQHGPTIDRLIDAITHVVRDPADRTIDAALRDAVDAASHALEPHLALEEREIFPLLRGLPAADTARIRAGMQARRETRLRR